MSPLRTDEACGRASGEEACVERGPAAAGGRSVAVPWPWLTPCWRVPATKGTGCPWPASSPSAAWPAVTFGRGESPLPAQKLRAEAKGKLAGGGL